MPPMRGRLQALGKIVERSWAVMASTVADSSSAGPNAYIG